MLANLGRNAVVGLRNTAADGSQSVTISADGNSIPDSIFKSSRLKEGHQRLWHCALTSYVELIGCPDAIKCKVQRIIILLDVITDFQNAAPCTGHIDSDSGGFGALQPFRMVMSHLGNFPREQLGFLQTGSRKTSGANPHSSSIAETVVGVRMI